jgi:hypothetical protein
MQRASVCAVLARVQDGGLILSRVCGDYTRRGLDLLGLDTGTLNHSVYTSQLTRSCISLCPFRLATTLMASLAFTKLLSLGLLELLSLLSWPSTNSSSQSYVTTDDQSVSKSWIRAPAENSEIYDLWTDGRENTFP